MFSASMGLRQTSTKGAEIKVRYGMGKRDGPRVLSVGEKPSLRALRGEGGPAVRTVEEGLVNPLPERPLTRSARTDHPLPALRGEGSGFLYA